MYAQIEITTVCNSRCFYCPNDTIRHSHMEWECFEKILQTHNTPTSLLLQGTGEPLIHPFFWKMVTSSDNQDGISQNSELKTLAELGITEIRTTATAVNSNDDLIVSDEVLFTCKTFKTKKALHVKIQIQPKGEDNGFNRKVA